MGDFTLTDTQKQLVRLQTQYYVDQANQLMSLGLQEIPVYFDLKGKSSGMFVVKNKQHYIRYNEMIFSEYFDDALVNTVAHEVAHYVVYSTWGLKKTRPHGIEWKQVMAIFGVKAEVTSDYEIAHIPLKKQRRFDYTCGCMTHQLSTTRHNKVQARKAIYHCRQCRQPLKHIPAFSNV